MMHALLYSIVSSQIKDPKKKNDKKRRRNTMSKTNHHQEVKDLHACQLIKSSAQRPHLACGQSSAGRELILHIDLTCRCDHVADLASSIMGVFSLGRLQQVGQLVSVMDNLMMVLRAQTNSLLACYCATLTFLFVWTTQSPRPDLRSILFYCVSACTCCLQELTGMDQVEYFFQIKTVTQMLANTHAHSSL